MGGGKVEGEGLKGFGAHGWADSWPPLGPGWVWVWPVVAR